MALGYSPVNFNPPAGVPGGAVPPTIPGATPGGYGGFPRGGPPSGPFRIGGGYSMPSWLQDKINMFNSMHNQAVAARGGGVPTAPGPGGVNVPGAGQGYAFGPASGHWWGQDHTGPPLPPTGGPPGPPDQQPPDWQSYWEQWYRSRQPYADWLSGYVRGAY